MDIATLTALQGSIDKWEKIVAGTGTNEGPANCPLCQMFFYDDNDCEGCPVYATTGKRFCDGTPYHEYEALDFHKASENYLKKAAKKELDFLKSLLPKERDQ